MNSKYRKSLLGVVKEVEGGDWRVEPLTDVAAHAETLHALYRNVWSRAPSRGPALPVAYVPALAEALGDRHRVIVVRQGERLGGFVTVIKDGDTALGYLVAPDRSPFKDS